MGDREELRDELAAARRALAKIATDGTPPLVRCLRRLAMLVSALPGGDVLAGELRTTAGSLERDSPEADMIASVLLKMVAWRLGMRNG